jgi:gamma-glutamylcyclotransferase (GGCT)/AIG2-like uncharacterized protein YtfP
MNHLVFVYGTLKKGGMYHYLLEDAQYCGRSVTCDTCDKMQMFDQGEYPVVIRSATLGYAIRGELWRVSASTLQKLDDLEGLDEGLYQRIETQVRSNGELFTAWIYLYLPSTESMLECGCQWENQPASRKVVLVDGDCVFCLGSAQWFYARTQNIAFASQQSVYGRYWMQKLGLEKKYQQTMIYLNGDQVDTQYNAVLALLKQTQISSTLLFLMHCIPLAFANLGYQLVAHFRHWIPTDSYCDLSFRIDHFHYLE